MGLRPKAKLMIRDLEDKSMSREGAPHEGEPGRRRRARPPVRDRAILDELRAHLSSFKDKVRARREAKSG